MCIYIYEFIYVRMCVQTAPLRENRMPKHPDLAGMLAERAHRSTLELVASGLFSANWYHVIHVAKVAMPSCCSGLQVQLLPAGLGESAGPHLFSTCCNWVEACLVFLIACFSHWFFGFAALSTAVDMASRGCGHRVFVHSGIACQCLPQPLSLTKIKRRVIPT